MFSELRGQLRTAARQLGRSPGFSLAAIGVLGLAIGLNVTLFSVVEAVVLRPPAVRDPGGLYAVYRAAPGELLAEAPLATADVLDLAAGSPFAATLAYAYRPMILEHAAEHRLVLGVVATPNLFGELGLRPALGRFFQPAEERSLHGETGALPEVVLSYHAWQHRWASDPAALGGSLRINGAEHRIVGVAPESFPGLTRGVAPEAWLPLALPRMAPTGAREALWLWTVGRALPGKSPAAIQAELDALATRVSSEQPAGAPALAWTATPLAAVRILPALDARLGGAAALVLVLVGLVLLVACSNVAHLVLARGLSRQGELATRRALGASTGALLRQLLAESLLLALAGGGLGLGFAALANAALGRLRLPLPVDLDLGLAIDGRVLLFTLGASLLAALASGLAPALVSARAAPGNLLRAGTATHGRGQARLGGLLVVAELGLTAVLLVDAGLAARSLARAHLVDPGFDPRGVAVLTLAPRLQGYDAARAAELERRLEDAARALPGVEAAGFASHLPLTIEARFDELAAEPPALPAERWPRIDSALVGPGYFAALGIPLLSGRPFTADDRDGAPRVAVINASLAERLWPATSALGQRLRVRGVAESLEVVGVVADGKYRTLGEAPRPFLYRPLRQERGVATSASGEISSGSVSLVVKSHGAEAATLAALRDLVRGLDPQLAIARLEPLRQTLGLTLFLPRLLAVLFLLFGGLGLVLAVSGLYGLSALVAGQRQREIAVRIALGASQAQVLRLVGRRRLWEVALGLGLGLALAAASTGALRALLYGLSPLDPPTFAVATGLLAAAGVAAALLPALRASRQAPARLLAGN